MFSELFITLILFTYEKHRNQLYFTYYLNMKLIFCVKVSFYNAIKIETISITFYIYRHKRNKIKMIYQV